MVEIVIDKVWKEYGDTVILENVSLTLKDHEFLSILHGILTKEPQCNHATTTTATTTSTSSTKFSLIDSAIASFS